MIVDAYVRNGAEHFHQCVTAFAFAFLERFKFDQHVIDLYAERIGVVQPIESVSSSYA